MYSLYRAWLSLGPCPVVVPPQHSSPSSHHQPLNLSSNTSGAPDVSLQVGPAMTQFSAHRAVLSAHSGFFKAALTHSENSGPIAVPNVNVDEFSSLLTFMYTGFLDLNLGNIYNILLATHILHMPRALEICRSFLLQSQPIAAAHHHSLLSSNSHDIIMHHNQAAAAASSASSSTIIKPIPNRKVPSSTSHQQIFAPSAFSHFEKSESTPFKSVISESNKTNAPEKETADGALISEKEATLAAPPPPPQIPSEKKFRSKTKKASSLLVAAAACSSALTLPSTSSSDHPEKVVIDIACCDGPVRFHRVINKNYGSSNHQASNNNESCSASSTSTNNLYEMQEEINRNAALNKAMTESIQQQLNTSSSSNEILHNQNNNEMFTCLYCNHTFKSQYCYQKHARRHLNPVSLDGKNVTSACTSSSASSSSVLAVQRRAASPNRENKLQRSPIKLLDMNVQYYPCKTCGSKFPSYYFVHKHRKLCHADEMADNTNKNNEMLPENSTSNSNSNSNKSDSESSAQIDVEGVNNDD